MSLAMRINQLSDICIRFSHCSYFSGASLYLSEFITTMDTAARMRVYIRKLSARFHVHYIQRSNPCLVVKGVLKKYSDPTWNQTCGMSNSLSSKPVTPDFSQKWSHHGRNVKHQLMRQQVKEMTDDTIHLDVGQPNKALSPVTGFKVQMSDGGEIAVDKNLLEKLAVYNESDGLPELKQFLTGIQRKEHNPPLLTQSDGHSSDFDMCLTCGTTDALHSVMLTFMDDDDTILMERTNYVSFIINLQTHGRNIQGVSFDDKGMVPEALEDVLSNWNQQHQGKPLPKLLYAVTSASNPIGYNWCPNRMLEIYLICRKYDILILDDGAYHFLQYGKRPPSFQSLDVDGRVIRFDTFSKLIGAGYRLGWVTGHRTIIDKLVIGQELTCVHPSMLAQVVVYSMMEKWGNDGFEKRARTVANFYKKQAECLIAACDVYLKDFATWTVPTGGMFTWITFKECISADALDVCRELELNKDIRVINGRFFQTDPVATSRSLRVCYSSASHDSIKKAIKCLSEILQEKRIQGDYINSSAN